MKQSLWTGLVVISGIVGWTLWSFKQLQLAPLKIKHRVDHKPKD